MRREGEVDGARGTRGEMECSRKNVNALIPEVYVYTRGSSSRLFHAAARRWRRAVRSAATRPDAPSAVEHA